MVISTPPLVPKPRNSWVVRRDYAFHEWLVELDDLSLPADCDRILSLVAAVIQFGRQYEIFDLKVGDGFEPYDCKHDGDYVEFIERQIARSRIVRVFEHPIWQGEPRPGITQILSRMCFFDQAGLVQTEWTQDLGSILVNLGDAVRPFDDLYSARLPAILIEGFSFSVQGGEIFSPRCLAIASHSNIWNPTLNALLDRDAGLGDQIELDNCILASLNRPRLESFIRSLARAVEKIGLHLVTTVGDIRA